MISGVNRGNVDTYNTFVVCNVDVWLGRRIATCREGVVSPLF